MRNRYIDLIEQTFEFPQEEFTLSGNSLRFHDIPLLELLNEYGTPLKISYLPKISSQIERSRKLFRDAFSKVNYKGDYYYCYCTKSSHFAYVLKEALKNSIYLETSSAYDISIIQRLRQTRAVNPDTTIICNGYKDAVYIQNIRELINSGHTNVIPIIDNVGELNRLDIALDDPVDIGIRIASEESPKFQFYTSRLGIGYKDVIEFYRDHLRENPKFNVTMLHFFVNTGITDTAYYWNELSKCVRLYCKLKKICPSLKILDIGGGLPIKQSLDFSYDYEYTIEEIINQIKIMCDEADVEEPDIYTEFGSFTVGESGATFFSILDVKQQNDRECWYMIDSSFMTTLPDCWAINKRFIMLPVNNWDRPYKRVLLGGLTCDSDDYYDSEQHTNAIYLPVFSKKEVQYIGFFHTGAYQDAIGGFGGVQHCLIPKPAHVVIDRSADGSLSISKFCGVQSPESMLALLGYG